MPRPRTRSDLEVFAAIGRAVDRLGPGRLTLAEVAVEAGLAPATLVQRFGGKRELLLAFAEHAAEGAGAPFREARAAVDDPLAALWMGLVAASAVAADRGRIANNVAFLLEDLEDPALRAAAARHAERTEAAIRALLEEAAAAGALPAVDPARLARTLHAAWQGALLQWALRGEDDLAAWLEDTLEPLLPEAR